MLEIWRKFYRERLIVCGTVRHVIYSGLSSQENVVLKGFSENEKWITVFDKGTNVLFTVI